MRAMAARMTSSRVNNPHGGGYPPLSPASCSDVRCITLKSNSDVRCMLSSSRYGWQCNQTINTVLDWLWMMALAGCFSVGGHRINKTHSWAETPQRTLQSDSGLREMEVNSGDEDTDEQVDYVVMHLQSTSNQSNELHKLIINQTGV